MPKQMTAEIAAIFQPALALVLLTFVVWVYMYIRRIGWMRANRVHPDRGAKSRAQREFPADVAASSDNLENLFEMPVLFYFATVVLYVAANVDTVAIWLAWVYVALRYVHSFIHCRSGRVIYRFSVYNLSNVVLLVIWLRIAVALLK